MAKFLRTSGISHHIEQIILQAQKELVLVSPYLKLSKTFMERLNDASANGVNIKIIYGKSELKDDQLNSLQALKNTQLYYCENLHAKCYFNESQMVITSMNFYEFSEKNNREMGVFIEHNSDKALFDDAAKETKSIIGSSVLKWPPENKVKEVRTYSKPQAKKFEKYTGNCIRCEDEIKYNPEKPYCTNCFSSWNEWQNFDYKESVCHKCGRKENTTILKPECYNCYRYN